MFSNPFLLEYLALLLDSMQIHSLTEYWAISPNLVWPPLSKLNHNIQSFPILAFTPFTYSKEQPQYMIYSFPMLFAELLRFFPRKDGSVSIFKCLKLTDWLQQPYFSLLLWKTQISLPQAGLDDLCFSASITEIKKKKKDQVSTGSKSIEADGFQLPRSHPSPVQSLLQELPSWFPLDNSNCHCSNALKCWEQWGCPSYHAFHTSCG